MVLLAAASPRWLTATPTVKIAPWEWTAAWTFGVYNTRRGASCSTRVPVSDQMTQNGQRIKWDKWKKKKQNAVPLHRSGLAYERVYVCRRHSFPPFIDSLRQQRIRNRRGDRCSGPQTWTWVGGCENTEIDVFSPKWMSSRGVLS